MRSNNGQGARKQIVTGKNRIQEIEAKDDETKSQRHRLYSLSETSGVPDQLRVGVGTRSEAASSSGFDAGW